VSDKSLADKSLAADPGSVKQAAAAVARGDSEPVGLLEKALGRIEAVEKDVQGWRLLDRDRAFDQAKTLRDEAAAGRIRGALHGIPIAIKDVIDVAGLPTRAGSAIRAAVAPSTLDAHVVARARAAGAVILGKAHTTEFAYFDGPPPTRNPHDLAHTPGGSSGGPAAVVAAGMVPVSLGTQTAGSVSRPAAYCGIAAFKPSTGGWSSAGVVPFAPSYDTIGVFGHRVGDAVAAANALAPSHLRQASPLPATLTIGFADDPILADASAEVAATLRQAADALSQAGFRITRFASPVPFADVVGWHKTVIEYEVARAHPGLALVPEVSGGLRDAIGRGRVISDQAYHAAWAALANARDRFWAATGNADAVLFPAAPDVAPAGMKTGDPRFIVPFTVFGGPIVSIPVGFGAGGLPLGVMLTSPPGSDATLATMAGRVAKVIELPR
jgi:aspartyl-tRNA(Asn)/glutamyl-tRNA(Gln) amidotransferase subunit A